jgi:hypothetical protein
MNRKLLTAILVLCTVLMPLQAKRVKGIVNAEGNPIGDVIVSDGYRFTKTAADGTFSFNTHRKARFVFVVTPSGYVADFSSGAPQFYVPLKGKRSFSFSLSRFGEGTDYTVFSVSDPQMQNAKHLKRFRGRPLEDLREMAAEYSAKRPTIGIALGDIAWNKLDMFPSYKESIATTGIPFYAVIGNHDFIQNKSSIAAGAAYEAEFGPYNYAFFLGNDLFIGLNDIIFKASGIKDSGKSSNNYKEGYSEEALGFVKGLLEYIPEGTHIFIAQHSPIRFLQANRQDTIVNADRMTELLKDYKVDILSGHTHLMNNQIISESLSDHNAAAIGGAWWATDWCRDGTPRGYQIITSVSGTLEWGWHNLDYPDDFQVRFLGKGEAQLHPDHVLANVWMADDTWTVEWYQDGTLMGPAEPVWEISPDYAKEILDVYKGNAEKIPGYKRAQPQTHFYAALPSEDAKTVTIVVTAPDGRRWQHDFNF